MKTMNRYFEWRLCCLESLFSLISMIEKSIDDRIKDKITAIWKSTLLNQFHDVIEWHTCLKIVKWDLYTKTEAEWVVAETPYGTNKRSTRPTANHDKPRWENYHQTWVDIISKDDKWGLAVISKDNYGYDADKGRLGLTLIRGAKYPEPAKAAWVNNERNRTIDKTGELPIDHAGKLAQIESVCSSSCTLVQSWIHVLFWEST